MARAELLIGSRWQAAAGSGRARQVQKVTSLFNGATAGTVSLAGPEEVEAALAAAERGAAVRRRTDVRVDRELLGRAPRLRVPARTGVGVGPRRRAGSDRPRDPGRRHTRQQHARRGGGVLFMTLHLTKCLRPLTDLVHQGRWAERSERMVGDLDGATMGIVGYGRIGRRVAELATACGMRTLANDPFSPPPAEYACPDLTELAATADVLTLHLPLNEDTRHLIDGALLQYALPGTLLINCGRGGLIDPDAALSALESGRSAGSAWMSSAPNHRADLRGRSTRRSRRSRRPARPRP